MSEEHTEEEKVRRDLANALHEYAINLMEQAEVMMELSADIEDTDLSIEEIFEKYEEYDVVIEPLEEKKTEVLG